MLGELHDISESERKKIHVDKSEYTYDNAFLEFEE
jgi:hypothetical protein